MKIIFVIPAIIILNSFVSAGICSGYNIDSLINVYKSIENVKVIHISKYLNHNVLKNTNQAELANILWQNRYSNPDTVSMICKKALDLYPDNKDYLLCPNSTLTS
ncbi:MAG: hypothetical protein GVY19_09330 [Bacteroidetes bacterium]|jgi:hypothetical protein|nr:hypothetical protein [Bacteroidota bacterium]